MLKEYVVVDLEMTGLKPARDKILEIGGTHIKDGVIVKEYHTLVNPGMIIPKEVTELTGITQEMAEEGVDIQRAMRDFLEFADNFVLVGHNILYDYSFLKQNAVNCNLTLESPVVDTLKLSRKLLPDLESKTLESVCNYFGIKREQQHRALEDARATGQILEELKRRFGEEQSRLFEPYTISYKVKKQGPITPRQKKYLKELVNYHKIELSVSIDSLTRSEASRLTDKLLSQYGRASGKQI